MVLIVEDIHGLARAASYDLRTEVAGPILVLCPARAEFLEFAGEWSVPADGRSVLELEGLPIEAGEQLIEATPGGHAIHGSLRQRILETAEGNPLFVEEMVRLVAESGQESVAVPPTIEALMAARIDQLPRAELAVAQHGAVIGRVFERASVEALMIKDDLSDLDAW